MLFEFLQGKAGNNATLTLPMMRELGAAMARLHLIPAADVVPFIDQGGCCMIGEAQRAFLDLEIPAKPHLGDHEYVKELTAVTLPPFFIIIDLWHHCDFLLCVCFLLLKALPSVMELLHRQSLPQGIIHTDLFADNALFLGDVLVAVVDFEEVCQGPCVLDAAMTTMACCFKATPPTYKDTSLNEDLAAAFLAGYTSVREFTKEEQDLLGEFLKVACRVISFWRFRHFNVRKEGLSSDAERLRHLEMDERRLFIDRWVAEGGQIRLLQKVAQALKQ